MEKIKFYSGSSSAFFISLDKDVRTLLSSTNLLLKAKRILWVKTVFYALLHLSSYLILYLVIHTGIISLILNYIFIGLSGLLLAFNVSHDACHEAYSKNKTVNYWLYHLSFN